MYKYKQIITASLIAITTFSATYLICDFTLNKKTEIIDNTSSNIIDHQNEGYIVRSYNGKISVFVENQVTPIYSLNSPYVRDLTDYDQNLLNEGIKAQSQSELMRILEDFDN